MAKEIKMTRKTSTVVGKKKILTMIGKHKSTRKGQPMETLDGQKEEEG